MSLFFERAAKSALMRLLRETLNRLFPSKPKDEGDKPLPTSEDAEIKKSHPWRLCPLGEHWVRSHALTVPGSGKGPTWKTTRHGFCRKTSGRAEYYTGDELREIAIKYFHSLSDNPNFMPIADSLDFPNGNKYDQIIAGWTKFWNEVLSPNEILTPDFVKALVATESSFDLTPDVKSKDGLARGLIQITEGTRQILQNPKGELRDHLIELTVEESREPEINIGTGIRWLHHKKYLAEYRLKRKLSWEEAGAEYKGIFSDLGKDKKSDDIMKKLRSYHKRLRDQRKQR